MVDAQKCLTKHNMTELSYFSASVSGVLLMTTIPANLVLMLVLTRNMKLLRQSMFYKLIYNIVSADLLTALISNPVSMMFHLKEGLREVNYIRWVNHSPEISSTFPGISIVFNKYLKKSRSASVARSSRSRKIIQRLSHIISCRSYTIIYFAFKREENIMSLRYW